MISSSVLLAGPASGNPVWLTIRLHPRKGWSRSKPTRSAAATYMLLECAPPIARIFAMTSVFAGWSGMGTQLVCNAKNVAAWHPRQPIGFRKPAIVADRHRHSAELSLPYGDA